MTMRLPFVLSRVTHSTDRRCSVKLIKRLFRRHRKPVVHYHLTVTNPPVDVREQMARMERIESRWH